MAAAEWLLGDCDYCGGAWSTADSPPEFNLPPPPLPPFMQPPPEYCSSSPSAVDLETCQAFLVEDAEYQVPLDSPPSLAAIIVSAAILTAVVILIATLLLWRYRKQKEQQKVVIRCQQKSGLVGGGHGGGMMDTVPALLQGLAGNHQGRSGHHNGNDDPDTVFYDELISYPTHYRTPHHHHQPPAYEMKDVLLKSPCHCTAHPLLGRGGRGGQQHYVTSPYHSSSNCSSSTPTTNADDRGDSGSWIAEPVYEELPSGPEDDLRSPRDQRRNNQPCYGNSNVGVHHESLLRGYQRGGSSVRRNGSMNQSWKNSSSSSGGCGETEPGETDLFLAPTTWYQQHNNIRGQLTAQGPVRPGRGGVRAAWRELESDKLKHKIDKSGSMKSNSLRQDPAAATPQMLHYQTAELYRGKCPPEEPPASFDDEDSERPLHQADQMAEQQPGTTKKATLPRYYYYSESDDYGVNNNSGVQRTLSSSTTGRRGQLQRHYNRAQRTPLHRSPTSDLP